MKLPVIILTAGATGIAVLCAYFLFRGSFRGPLCANLSCVSMPGITAYRLKETYTDTPTVYRSLYASGGRYIRIEAMKSGADEAIRDIRAEVARMKALFEKAPAPYPGDISDSVVCSPEFVPSYHTDTRPGGMLEYFVGYLNDRLTFGSCSGENAQYRGILAFTYCPAEKLRIRIELIAPVADFAAHENELVGDVKSLTCR